MQILNLTQLSFTYEQADPDGFQSGMFRVGPQLGAEQTGATVYELPAGQAVCPYHYEYGEEEWLFVLTGNPSIRHPDGVRQLRPSDLVFFPRGPEGAHQVLNESEEPARILMFSTVLYPTATVYPDSGKLGVWTGNKDDDLIVETNNGVDYWKGEGR